MSALLPPLKPGKRVIVYPSDSVAPGVRIAVVRGG